MRATPGQQHDRLEQAGLAGRIGPPDELRAGSEVGVEGRVAAQVAELDRLEQTDTRAAVTRPPQEVVRTGMTTWV